MNILKQLTLADGITLAGAAAGFFSILTSVSKQFSAAAMLMLAAVVLDWADGRVARWQKKQHAFGRELDSLADGVSFGVAPVVFGYEHAGTVALLVAGLFFLLCGIARLARFNITKHHSVFEGVPITTNGVVVPLAYWLGAPNVVYAGLFVVMGLLMVSSVAIKKWR